MSLPVILNFLANIGSVASIAVSGGKLARENKMWIYVGVGVSLAAVLIMLNRDKIFKPAATELPKPEEQKS